MFPSCFNRRRDACFPATFHLLYPLILIGGFNRRRDACFPATKMAQVEGILHAVVSIADATLASPQLHKRIVTRAVLLFQSQTRRLLPRNLPVAESFRHMV